MTTLVPTGVPGGGVVDPPPPPPPQPTLANASANATRARAKLSRRLAEEKPMSIRPRLNVETSAIFTPVPGAAMRSDPPTGFRTAAPLDVKVTVLVPLPVTDGAEQVTPDGRSEQASVTTPVKPFSAVTVTDAVPMPPAVLIVGGVDGSVSDKVKSTPCVEVAVFQTVGALTRLATFIDPRPVA